LVQLVQEEVVGEEVHRKRDEFFRDFDGSGERFHLTAEDKLFKAQPKGKKGKGEETNVSPSASGR